MRKILIPAAVCAALTSGCSGSERMNNSWVSVNYYDELGYANKRPMAPSPIADSAMKKIARIGWLKGTIWAACRNYETNNIDNRYPIDYTEMDVSVNTAANLFAVYKRARDQADNAAIKEHKKDWLTWQEMDPASCDKLYQELTRSIAVFENEIVPDLTRHGY